MCPWSQPGTVRHRGLFYKYAEHLWVYASTSKLCVLGGLHTHSPASCLPWGSQEIIAHWEKKGLTMRYGNQTGKGRKIQTWLEWTAQQDDSPQACRAVVPKERTSKRELGGVSDAPETWPFNRLATGPQQATIRYKLKIRRPNPGCQRPCP